MLKINSLAIKLFLALYLVSIYVEYIYMWVHMCIMSMLLFRSPGRMPCPNYEVVEFQPRTVDNSAH